MAEILKVFRDNMEISFIYLVTSIVHTFIYSVAPFHSVVCCI